MKDDGFDAAKDYVRVGVKSGGCSGLSYELKFCSQESIQISYDICIEISQNLSNFIKYLNNNTKD